jgi:hypothetical protein
MDIIEKKIENNIMNDTIEKNDTHIFQSLLKKEPSLSKPSLSKLSLSKLSLSKPSCGLIVIDNFYNNPLETRNYILKQEFSVKGNFPGQRTISYATEHLKDIIQKYIEPFSGKITYFPCPNDKNEKEKEPKEEIYNGSFQYTTARDRSWIHTDKWNNWAGVLFMTPDAPLSSGTAFYRFNDGATCESEGLVLNNKNEVDRWSQDFTKWELVDTVGNVFNRLVLFNAHRYHMSMDYFGDTKENGRLFQTFFFSTEKN